MSDINVKEKTQNDPGRLKVTLAGITLDNPVIPASGTFGYGKEFADLYDLDILGSISFKGTTVEKRYGNPLPRIADCTAGMLNSVGLQNPGIDAVIQEEIPRISEIFHKPVIANICGFSVEEYAECCQKIDSVSNVGLIELNISCPNVKAAGLAWGLSPDTAYYCISSVRAVTKKPLMVKLSPNAPDNRPIALACIKAGADALSLINMVHGVAIDIEKGKPFFNNVHAGYSGPGLKPLALRIVYDVVEEINKLPTQF